MHLLRHRFTRFANPSWNGLVVTAGLLLAAAAHETNGATINARSPALADITTAIALAKEGDTVLVPAGTVHWTNQLSISKGVVLKGATTVNGAGTKTPTVSDLTVIINDITGAPNLVDVRLTAAQNFQLTGFTFRAGLSSGSLVHLVGNGNAPVMGCRVDHCHFVGSTGRSVQTDGWLYGVADHNFIETKANGQSFYINAANYAGKLLGHGSWADYPWFGTERFFFIEDNTMTGEGKNSTNGALDSEYGGRWVVRHNYFINCRPGWHGTEGGNRGCRAVEVYDNTFDWSIIFSAMARSGSTLYHDNKWVGTGKSPTACHSSIAVFREYAGVTANCLYGFADGTGPFDQNDTEGNGTYVAGHAPHVFDSGTISLGGTGTVKDGSKDWTTNKWAGYSIKQTTQSAASCPKGSYVETNTNNQITYRYYSSGDRGPALSFAAGDSYKIHRVLVALDQIGRGKGDLLSGGSTSAPINTVSGGATWPRQALEPAMSWNNVDVTGSPYGFNSSFPTVKLGRDYYNLGKGFPAGSTPSQVSSIYSASLNGVAYTGTYTYPHPLTGPAPPTNLSIVSGP
jgi:hypothetical protein